MEKQKSLRQTGLLVYFCGLGTSALVLYGVDLANEHNENIMGWYANGIIPAGALLVGIASGLGYALGSYFLNVKISSAFVKGMLLTALLDYVAAQYVTYSNVLEKYHATSDRYSFLQYVQDICEHMAFKSHHSYAPGSELGFWGYVFKVLEMGGYAFGATLPTAILFKMPYCHGCQSYLKKNLTTYISDPLLKAEWKKLPKPQRLEALQSAVNQLAARAQAISGRVAQTTFAETQIILNECSPKW